MKHYKKFSFYVNRCPDCLEITYISLRPHKGSLCVKCSSEIKKQYEQLKTDKRNYKKENKPIDNFE